MNLFSAPLQLIATATVISVMAWGSLAVAADNHSKPPNIVLIFTDDLGYADLGCFGSQTIRTPRIDALAAEGTRFTDFYVAQAVCSASRAALMTGCYANRVGLAGALNHTSPAGINPDELLLPEMLQSNGYATGIYGKWHLGLSPYFSPLKNGFDDYLGIPYSNDNTKYHPTLAEIMPPLPLYDGDEVIETDPDQSLLTKRFTQRAVDFIHRHQDQPFFLYVPHVMPHVPIFASDDFRGRSPYGLYADVIEEIDWSVGQIVDAVEAAGLSENTLIIFTSDNGPFLSYGTHAGDARPLREGKLTCFEGGVRVPTLMRWPGRVPAGKVCDQPLMTIDLLPTFAAWVGAELPEQPIDGKDISDVIFGVADAQSPHESLLFYSGTELHAVRSGPWKMHLDHPYLTVIGGEVRSDGKPAGYGTLEPKSITQSGVEGIASRHGYRIEQQKQALYHLGDDPGESVDVSAANPEIVQKLLQTAAIAREKLGDSLTGAVGSEIRSSGRSDGALQ
jgi:arylsulfatase A-like enzyme